MPSNSVLYDGASGVGNHSQAFQVGPQIKWVDDQTRGTLYSRRYRQRTALWTPRTLSSAGPAGGWLVEETQPSSVGAGLIEWERVYAYLPPDRTRGETTVYNHQEIQGTNILEVPITTTALVDYKYFHAVDPSTIPQLRAYRLIKVGEDIYSLGPAPATGAQLVLAEDSRVRQYRGHIYERASIYVRPATFTAS